MAFHGSADSAGSPARPLEAADSGPGGRMRKLGSLRTLWPFLARTAVLAAIPLVLVATRFFRPEEVARGRQLLARLRRTAADDTLAVGPRTEV